MTSKLLSFLTFTLFLFTNIHADEYNNNTSDTFVDTLAIKMGQGITYSSISYQNNAIQNFDYPEIISTSYCATLVFNTDWIPYIEPYLEFNTHTLNDRFFFIPSIGIRHDFTTHSKTIKPFLSFGVGYDILRWTLSTYHPDSDVILGGEDFVYTFQAGSEFYISKSLAFDMTLRFDAFNIFDSTTLNTTIVDPNSQSQVTIHERGTLALLFGVVYRFGQ